MVTAVQGALDCIGHTQATKQTKREGQGKKKKKKDWIKCSLAKMDDKRRAGKLNIVIKIEHLSIS